MISGCTDIQFYNSIASQKETSNYSGHGTTAGIAVFDYIQTVLHKNEGEFPMK